jgi:hypothetical protein
MVALIIYPLLSTPFLVLLHPAAAHITADKTDSIGIMLTLITVINPKHKAKNLALFISICLFLIVF